LKSGKEDKLSQFTLADKAAVCPTDFEDKDTGYYSDFFHQHIRVPDNISRKVDALYCSEEPRVTDCIKLIITNFFAQGMFAFSGRAEHYSEHGTPSYTRTYFPRAVELLLGDGYAYLEHKGTKRSTFATGISSRLSPTWKLFVDFPEEEYAIKKAEVDVTRLPIISINKKPIYTLDELESASLSFPFPFINSLYLYNSPISITSQSFPYFYLYSNPFSSYLSIPLRNMAEEALELNRNYFNNIHLDFSRLGLTNYVEQVGVTRAFNDEGCGRWFQKGGLSYLDLDEDERALILINGDDVAELDYSGMHPNIAYAWERQHAPDIYGEVINHLQTKGYPTTDRFAVKKVLLTCLNAHDQGDLLKGLNHDSYEQRRKNPGRIERGKKPKPVVNDEMKKMHPEHGLRVLKDADLKPVVVDIVDAVRAAHPVIAKYVYTGSANRFMWAESLIMTAVLQELRKRNIPAVPVHDSVLFPKQHYDTVYEVMRETYRAHAGFDIVVKP
jgi:hypothetical protein